MKADKEAKIKFCIQLQISAVIKLIMQKYNKSIEQATHILYGSETYKMLNNIETRLWAESPYFVLDYLENELAGVPREER